ncbi:polymer-forming cytoskeletal protein [Altererythrobacter sp. SALINAS58]|uniref:bactofilin family protein n=1 Tax=Alteripontixanthobacter muriae TaxID=2705546 RepID=UPI001576DE12|nr:polymer-forming cytoskeletal protein [Alteripontixanthobacter muriae]NTZ43495.1 polymer-forming cytoskeletal protein [Alteripontixanthobacter muriae]
MTRSQSKHAHRPASSFSIIGSDVTITGDIAASADLHIDGTVRGDISCTALVQGEDSEIHGAIKAETARLAGRIAGSISARNLVVLRSARIEGDVRYEALTIEEGATVDGLFARTDMIVAAGITAQNEDEPKLTLAG